ncbi:MAG: hypothetical protein ABR874_14780 [Candidatus Sulfotelmatobacter sp.]|jgi:hypothetical protein
MNREQNELNSQNSYEPPRLTTISLRPEEAVLGHCKIVGGASGQVGTCNLFIGGCATQGS